MFYRQSQKSVFTLWEIREAVLWTEGCRFDPRTGTISAYGESQTAVLQPLASLVADRSDCGCTGRLPVECEHGSCLSEEKIWSHFSLYYFKLCLWTRLSSVVLSIMATLAFFVNEASRLFHITPLHVRLSHQLLCKKASRTAQTQLTEATCHHIWWIKNVIKYWSIILNHL